MEWIRQNWVFIIFFIIFIAMHLFGHGCMPGHGGHRGHEDEKEGEERKEKKGGHGCC